jgi:hypothetical protein
VSGSVLRAAAVAAIAVVVAACGGAEETAATPEPTSSEGPAPTIPRAPIATLPPSLPLRYSFDEADCPLVEVAESGVESVCADGVYRMTRYGAGLSATPRSFYPDAFALRVEVDVLPTVGESAYGVSCMQLHEGYHLVVAANGYYAILKEKPGERTILAEGTDRRAASDGDSLHLRADCIGGERGVSDSATLVLSVDGERIEEVRDPEPPRSFRGVDFGNVSLSLFPLADGGQTTVEFDDLVVAELDP